MILLVNTEKAYDENPPIFHNEYIQQTRRRKEILQPDEGHLWKTQSL